MLMTAGFPFVNGGRQTASRPCRYLDAQASGLYDPGRLATGLWTTFTRR
jgi:hypothetical protein